MTVWSLEHGKVAYVADHVLYAAAVVALGLYVTLGAPGAHPWGVAALVVLGIVVWTAVEYALHRFVMHGVQPFRRWHALHHERPAALICLPTALSAGLIATLVFLPALAWGGLWRASALTLGVLAGYLAYGLTHHATHHSRSHHPWIRERRRWHALHHHRGDRAVCYGVSTGFWDRLFGTAPAARS